MNQISSTLKVEKHPDKTFIGKIEKGFDFLGYHFSRKALELAEKTLERNALHIVRLYEQLRKKKATSIEMASTLGLYVTRWQRWAVAGLQGITIDGWNRNGNLTGVHFVNGQQREKMGGDDEFYGAGGTARLPVPSSFNVGPPRSTDASTMLTTALWSVLKYPT